MSLDWQVDLKHSWYLARPLVYKSSPCPAVFQLQPRLPPPPLLDVAIGAIPVDGVAALPAAIGARPAHLPSSVVTAPTDATPGPDVATPVGGKACMLSPTPSTPRPLAPSSSPKVKSLPAKRTRKRRNEAELLRGD